MVALLVDLWFDCPKEEPERRVCNNSRGTGRVVRLRAVNELPFFIEVGMNVSGTYALQHFFKTIVMLPKTQSYGITNGSCTADSFNNCSFCLAIRTRLCGR